MTDEPEMPEGWEENTCKDCGEHIGFGLPQYHIPYCDECAPKHDH